MALVTDPTDPDFDCYCSVAEADAFADNYLYADNWLGATAAVRERALRWATKLLDEHVEWNGHSAVSTQNLAWPRSYVRRFNRQPQEYFASDAVPDEIKYATARYADHLIAENKTAEQETGISALRVGSISLQFNTRDRKEVIPTEIRRLVEHYGKVRKAEGAIELVRT